MGWRRLPKSNAWLGVGPDDVELAVGGTVLSFVLYLLS